jgi:hypothetical protein
MGNIISLDFNPGKWSKTEQILDCFLSETSNFHIYAYLTQSLRSYVMDRWTVTYGKAKYV